MTDVIHSAVPRWWRGGWFRPRTGYGRPAGSPARFRRGTRRLPDERLPADGIGRRIDPASRDPVDSGWSPVRRPLPGTPAPEHSVAERLVRTGPGPCARCPWGPGSWTP